MIERERSTMREKGKKRLETNTEEGKSKEKNIERREQEEHVEKFSNID